MKLQIKGFIQNSLLDWDGKIVSTLYPPYCNFRCPFCHNKDLVNLKLFKESRINPLLQKEYYEMFAFFNNQDEPDLKIAASSDLTKEENVRKEIEKAESEIFLRPTRRIRG